MGNFSDDLNAAFEGMIGEVVADAEQKLGEDLADRCREAGLDNADYADITIEQDEDSREFNIDPERVRAIANQILVGDR
ncbi:hypothetical protein [Microbacterium sp. MM2322]|uniref:hypothetical protein n=1 Tax=Microbacterium sp. MM2322 TaxID=3157631 RepID=UPI0032D5784E